MSDGTPQSAPRTVLVALGVAVLFGIAVAGGSVFSGSGTEATTSDALPYAAVGATAALAMAGFAYAVTRRTSPQARLRPGHLVAAAFVVAVVGGLIGTALTPRPPTPQEVSPLDDAEIDRRSESLGELPEDTVARPVDLDGDGVADVDADGNPIIAYDEDGDGEIDGYLEPCPDPADATASAPFDTVGLPSGPAAPIDVECDGEVERHLEFDPTPFTSPAGAPPAPVGPLDTVGPDERTQRAGDDSADDRFWPTLRNALIGIVVIAALAAILLAYRRRRRRRGVEHERTPHAAAPDVNEPIARTIDAIERDVDPRQAICEAYGTLLAELAAIGLPRRPEEAPAEHVARCLQRAELDEASVTELTELFSLARFSTHPITEEHRIAAVGCLRRSVPRQPAVAGAGAWPAPPGIPEPA